MWQSGDCYLLHDNAPVHRSQFIKRFLSKTLTNVLPLPPSPYLARYDFYLFPFIGGKKLQEQHFVPSKYVKALS